MQPTPSGVLGIIKSSYTQVLDCSLYDIYTSYTCFCVCLCIGAIIKLWSVWCFSVSLLPILSFFSHMCFNEGVGVGHERRRQRGELVLAVGARAKLADV